ncbi:MULTISPECIES: FadR/GntR family transcriptional regulator [Streptomyces]|uniref:GntR family transcriptional regulator n=2 Tax=Streptomyces TaxID=1883 RepID=A0ABS9JF81_9ACTN|nr:MULTISPECIES: GntR family transcriptional regulator [Streptomyces]MCG0064240.1 GntR family transcriptional regulator [Streptomyces tricolor]BCM68368.1 putative GntR-family transcriptional regulator [Streptomyces sp. EAS-AB2608]CUW30011.1 Mannosyl-D-glycerate transport/metabolism system repressor MngR [Streptomyces reticuli]
MVVTQENVAVNGSSRRTSQQIADTLRERIRTGVLRVGERLPTQAELAEEFGVERGAVRQALRALQEDGLLSNVSKGSPPRVAEPAPAREEPQPTMVALAPRLTEAFSVPHVRIDAVCLTAQSLIPALGEPLRLIHDGRLRPERIDVRILLPSRDINLAFPVPVDSGSADDAVHQRWLAMRNAQGQVLQYNLQALRGTHDIDVHVTFRALPFTPPAKLYLLNGAEALYAYYMVTRRAEPTESGTLEMYDTLGSESLLFSFEKRAGQRDAAFVEQSQMWFDALWETITTDLTLS